MTKHDRPKRPVLCLQPTRGPPPDNYHFPQTGTYTCLCLLSLDFKHHRNTNVSYTNKLSEASIDGSIQWLQQARNFRCQGLLVDRATKPNALAATCSTTRPNRYPQLGFSQWGVTADDDCKNDHTYRPHPQQAWSPRKANHPFDMLPATRECSYTSERAVKQRHRLNSRPRLLLVVGRVPGPALRGSLVRRGGCRGVGCGR